MPLLCQYKGGMKFARLAFGLLLTTAIFACGAFPNLANIATGRTLTPSVTPTPTDTPTPTITPTPIPAVRVDEGERALFNGDYSTALIHFQTAYSDSSDPLVRASAKWGEARALYGDERLTEALAALQTLIVEYPDSTYLAHAHFMQGRTYFELQRYAEAAAAWQTYLVLRPGILDSYTQELRGDALFLAGNYSEALAAYTAAIQAPRLEDTATLDIKAADTRAKLQDYETSLAVYDGILGRPVSDYVKAQAVYEAGLVYEEQGMMAEAFGKFRFAVENYPLSYYSYLGLIELVEAGAEVDDLDRGLVDYHAGEYGGALGAFDRYLAANPINDGTAHFFRALALRELGNHEAEISEFTTFIEEYSSHPRWVEAWSEKAYTQWFYLGLNSEGAQTLLDFVNMLPAAPAAPDYLMAAARILERDDRLDEAALAWERVANEYPGNDQAPTAIFLSGIVRYRLADYEGASNAFSRSLVIALRPEDQARAYLWIGKSHLKLGDSAAAVTAWQQGQITDPDGYYSERIRDLLSDRAPFSPVAGEIRIPDLAAERADADAWMRLTFNLPAETALSGVGPMADDPRFLRGTELWNLGLYEEAHLEFEEMRESVSGSALDSYRLANYLLDLGLYRTAILAARETLTLAGLDEHSESMMAPPYFGHVRYGLYYSDLLIPDARAEALDPLLMYSVIRQESLFEGFIKSAAGARGLMQIVPGTGVEIASELGWPIPYDEDDLYRPDVSIRFGTHYLASNRRALEGDLYSALAAYNSGPGNAVIWKGLAGDDPDLFLEVVRFEETRTYIRSIYEIYVIYKRLYSASA